MVVRIAKGIFDRLAKGRKVNMVDRLARGIKNGPADGPELEMVGLRSEQIKKW